jgi:phage gpG-like protein
MDAFHMDIPGLSGFVQRFKGADKIVLDELQKAGKRAGLAVEAGAKRIVAVDTGNLRRSITSTQSPFGTTVTPLMTTTLVGTTVPYARVVEFGRGAGKTPPPSGVIAAWLSRKGGDPKAAYAVARAIGARGIKARAFLFNTFEQLKPQIRQEFDQVPKRVIARLRGGG